MEAPPTIIKTKIIICYFPSFIKRLIKIQQKELQFFLNHLSNNTYDKQRELKDDRYMMRGAPEWMEKG
jgi:hypothetical protein